MWIFVQNRSCRCAYGITAASALSSLMTSQSGPTLRLHPHCDPLSLAPSYPEFPLLISAGWPVGCRTPDPFSPRSSAEQETGSKVFRKSHRNLDNRPVQPPRHQTTIPVLYVLKLNCGGTGEHAQQNCDPATSDAPSKPPWIFGEQRLNLLLDINPCFVLRTIFFPRPLIDTITVRQQRDILSRSNFTKTLKWFLSHQV